MKKGKTAKIQNYNFAKVTYGTVDSVNLKSIYLNIQTWIEPKKECDNWNRVVLNMSRAIKHSVHYSINKKVFEEKFIVDLDLRSSGISVNKKSFMNLEINFFIKSNELDFKSKEIKNYLKEISNNVFKEIFYNNEHFSFHLTKKTKKLDSEDKY